MLTGNECYTINIVYDCLHAFVVGDDNECLLFS